MAGLFNSYYYGKAGKADFTVENLPKNRRELFFQTLRVRFSGIISVNLLFLVFCLPAIVWTGFNLLAILAASGLMAETAEGAEAALDASALQNTAGMLTTYLLGMVPCLGIAGIGSTGEMYVLRNWARDDHSFMFSDFKDAVKGNWKYGLLAGLINGLSLLLCYVAYMFYGNMATTDSVFFVIPQMFVVVCVVVWWMINMLIFPMMVTYDMKFGQLVRNCAIMVVARLPRSLLWLAVTALLPFILVMYIPYGIPIVAVLYLVIGFGLTGFIYASYANACFDRFLNPRIEGAPVNKGIYTDTDDDDDDEDDVPLPPRPDYSHPPVQRYEDLPKNGENKPEANSEDQPSGGEGA